VPREQQQLSNASSQRGVHRGLGSPAPPLPSGYRVARLFNDTRPKKAPIKLLAEAIKRTTLAVVHPVRLGCVGTRHALAPLISNRGRNLPCHPAELAGLSLSPSKPLAGIIKHHGPGRLRLLVSGDRSFLIPGRPERRCEG